MTSEQKQLLSQIIEQESKKLKKRLKELKEFTKPIAPDDAIGRVSRMDAINNRSVTEAGVRNIENRLRLLTRAARNIQNDDFGKCTVCKQSINFERLKLRPEIRQCTECVNKYN
jgi:DnaK suppressor protein